MPPARMSPDTRNSGARLRRREVASGWSAMLPDEVAVFSAGGADGAGAAAGAGVLSRAAAFFSAGGGAFSTATAGAGAAAGRAATGPDADALASAHATEQKVTTRPPRMRATGACIGSSGLPQVGQVGWLMGTPAPHPRRARR